MIHYECRLDKMLLTVCFKEEIHYIAFRVEFLIFDMMLFGQCLCCLIICYLIEVHIRIFLYAVIHSHFLEGLSKIKLHFTVLEFR